MSYDETKNWAEIKHAIGNLWPRWNPTPVEGDVWRKQLARYRPSLVIEALERVYADRPSDIPKLAYVRKAIGTVRNEMSVESEQQQAEPLAVRDARERKLIEQDRQRCLNKLRSIPGVKVYAARDAVVEKYRDHLPELMASMFRRDEYEQWSLGGMVFVLTELGHGAMFEDDAARRASA